MINDKCLVYESNLRKDFLEIVGDDNGDLVEDLLNCVTRDFILLAKKPLYCRDCLHCHSSAINGFLTSNPYYCDYYGRTVNLNHMECTDCSHYFSGEEEARKSIAKFHYDLTGNVFYE